MGNIATVGEERRRCFGIGGKPFALCVVTSPRGWVPSVRWMRKFSAVGAVSVGAGCSRCGECVGWVQSVRWMRGNEWGERWTVCGVGAVCS